MILKYNSSCEWIKEYQKRKKCNKHIYFTTANNLTRLNRYVKCGNTLRAIEISRYNICYMLVHRIYLLHSMCTLNTAVEKSLLFSVLLSVYFHLLKSNFNYVYLVQLLHRSYTCSTVAHHHNLHHHHFPSPLPSTPMETSIESNSYRLKMWIVCTQTICYTIFYLGTRVARSSYRYT